MSKQAVDRFSEKSELLRKLWDRPQDRYEPEDFVLDIQALDASCDTCSPAEAREIGEAILLSAINMLAPRGDKIVEAFNKLRQRWHTEETH